MGYYAAGDPGLFDWVGSAARWVAGAAKTVSNVPILGKALALAGGPIGLVSQAGSFLQGFDRGGLAGGVAGWLEPYKMVPGIGGTLASLGQDLLTQSGPPGAGVPAYEDLTTAMAPPFPSARGYSTAAWEDYDPYEDDFSSGFTAQEPNLGYTQPAFAGTSPGLSYAPAAPTPAYAEFRRTLKF